MAKRKLTHKPGSLPASIKKKRDVIAEQALRVSSAYTAYSTGKPVETYKTAAGTTMVKQPTPSPPPLGPLEDSPPPATPVKKPARQSTRQSKREADMRKAAEKMDKQLEKQKNDLEKRKKQAEPDADESNEQPKRKRVVQSSSSSVSPPPRPAKRRAAPKTVRVEKVAKNVAFSRFKDTISGSKSAPKEEVAPKRQTGKAENSKSKKSKDEPNTGGATTPLRRSSRIAAHNSPTPEGKPEGDTKRSAPKPKAVKSANSDTKSARTPAANKRKRQADEDDASPAPARKRKQADSASPARKQPERSSKRLQTRAGGVDDAKKAGSREGSRAPKKAKGDAKKGTKGRESSQEDPGDVKASKTDNSEDGPESETSESDPSNKTLMAAGTVGGEENKPNTDTEAKRDRRDQRRAKHQSEATSSGRVRRSFTHYNNMQNSPTEVKRTVWSQDWHDRELTHYCTKLASEARKKVTISATQIIDHARSFDEYIDPEDLDPERDEYAEYLDHLIPWAMDRMAKSETKVLAKKDVEEGSRYLRHYFRRKELVQQGKRASIYRTDDDAGASQKKEERDPHDIDEGKAESKNPKQISSKLNADTSSPRERHERWDVTTKSTRQRRSPSAEHSVRYQRRPASNRHGGESSNTIRDDRDMERRQGPKHQAQAHSQQHQPPDRPESDLVRILRSLTQQGQPQARGQHTELLYVREQAPQEGSTDQNSGPRTPIPRERRHQVRDDANEYHRNSRLNDGALREQRQGGERDDTEYNVESALITDEAEAEMRRRGYGRRSR